jgi:hypothetical protein
MKNPKKYSFLISKNFYILKFEKKSVTFFSAKNFFGGKCFYRFDRSGKHFPHTHNS